MSVQKPTIFKGLATAMITPFARGEIDYTAFGTMIDRQICGGADALLVAGTTGESATLTAREHYELIRFAAERIAGRVPLIAGCGSNATEHALTLVRSACDAGADALLAVTPYYNKTSEKGLVMHYHALSENSTRPLILYNVPSRTGMSISAELYRKLAQEKNIAAVKESSGDLALMEELCRECGESLGVYAGNDDQLLPAVRLGAEGIFSVYANLEPASLRELLRLCETGDFSTAGKKFRAILPQIRALFCEVNPIPVKYVAAMRGLCRAEYRLPLCPPSHETAKLLQSLF